MRQGGKVLDRHAGLGHIGLRSLNAWHRNNAEIASTLLVHAG
jgi:hypothetical protein